MNFYPCNCSLKIWEFVETITPKVGAHLEVWKFIPSHSPPLLGAWNVTPRLHCWPAPLQALALVTNPRLGLRHVQKKKIIHNKKIETKVMFTKVEELFTN